MQSTRKDASSRGPPERFAAAYPLYFRTSGLLGIAAVAATLMWANSLAWRVASGETGISQVLTLALETACLLIVLATLASSRRSCGLASSAAPTRLALPPAELARAWRRDGPLDEPSAACPRPAVAPPPKPHGSAPERGADPPQRARIELPATGCRAAGRSAAVRIPAREGAAGPGVVSARTARARLSPATRDSLRCPLLLSSQDVPAR